MVINTELQNGRVDKTNFFYCLSGYYSFLKKSVKKTNDNSIGFEATNPSNLYQLVLDAVTQVKSTQTEGNYLLLHFVEY